MSANDRARLAERIDPARVRALEQEDQAKGQLLYTRALTDVAAINNALTFLTAAAQQGDPQARGHLQALFTNLDRARAASAGIVVPQGAPAPGS